MDEAAPNPQRLNSSARTKSEAIPNEKPPKSRPPVGLRDKVLRAALPHYSGPYGVGLMDIELPAREPRTFSEIKRNHRHLLRLETVLFTIFYPSGFGSGQGKSPEGEEKWGRATWVPRPRMEAAKGYAKFAGLPEWVMIPLLGMSGKFISKSVTGIDVSQVFQLPSPRFRPGGTHTWQSIGLLTRMLEKQATGSKTKEGNLLRESLKSHVSLY
jgi:hypothetical protein